MVSAPSEAPPCRGLAFSAPAERAQAGGHHRVRVGADRGRHPRGERGRRQFVVGEQGHGRAQRAEQARIGPLRADLVPEPPGDAALGQPGGCAVLSRGTRVGQAVDHPGDDGAARGDDRGRVQVQPQRIGGGHRRDDDPQPFQRQRSLRERGLRAGAGRHRLGRGPPGPVVAVVAEAAGPQPGGHLLKRAPQRELGHLQAPVADPAVRDLGQLRLDDEVRGARRAARLAPLATPGQARHLVRLEQAAPPVLRAPPREHPPAHVRV